MAAVIKINNKVNWKMEEKSIFLFILYKSKCGCNNYFKRVIIPSTEVDHQTKTSKFQLGW